MLHQPDHSSSPAVQAPSLVLVAPMPRRPIALVARRRHHHHGSSSSTTSSHSHSRTSRTVSSSAGHSVAAASPDACANESAQPATSTLSSSAAAAANSAAQPTSAVRLVAHPYSRAKTPSNAAAALTGATGWPLGLGISPVSPPPRSRAASREGLVSRPLSRLSSREAASLSSSTVLSAIEAPAAEAQPADEPMLASPIASPPPKAASVVMDVERTPTKVNGRRLSNAAKHAQSHHRVRSEAEEDQEPRSTPTISANSPRPDDQGLTLSPVSPTQQRITAVASASAQLPLSFSSPPPPSGPIAETYTDGSPARGDASLASVSMAPSPCLSDSQSRSPSASPSPCPSPSFATLLDVEPPKHAGQAAPKIGLPLPPVPTSPIPRKMTRNPFERYLTIDEARGASCTLQARLAFAMHSAKQTRSVVDALEGCVQDADEEMSLSDAASPSLHRPALVSVNSNASAGSARMDIEE